MAKAPLLPCCSSVPPSFFGIMFMCLWNPVQNGKRAIAQWSIRDVVFIPQECFKGQKFESHQVHDIHNHLYILRWNQIKIRLFYCYIQSTTLSCHSSMFIHPRYLISIENKYLRVKCDLKINPSKVLSQYYYYYVVNNIYSHCHTVGPQHEKPLELFAMPPTNK